MISHDPYVLESSSPRTATRITAHLHPDFLNEQWTVPDIICHKWLQGCCDRNTYCWNQHGFTFDQALRQALRVQNQLRGGEPPYAYSSEDGCIQQVSREQAITRSMAGFRRTQIRKWRFGTNFTRYYDYEAWNSSQDAAALHEELTNQAGSTQRSRSPKHASSRRSSSRGPVSWTDRVQTPRRSGLFPPTTSGATSSFPPVSTSASTHRRPFFQINTDTDSDASAAPSFGTGASATAMERVGLRQRLRRRQPASDICSRDFAGLEVVRYTGSH